MVVDLSFQGQLQYLFRQLLRFVLGPVVTIPVVEGQAVKKGQVLLILESMKMQNELKSPRDGIVNRIKVKTGESVEQKQPLLSVQ